MNSHRLALLFALLLFALLLGACAGVEPGAVQVESSGPSAMGVAQVESHAPRRGDDSTQLADDEDLRAVVTPWGTPFEIALRYKDSKARVQGTKPAGQVSIAMPPELNPYRMRWEMQMLDGEWDSVPVIERDGALEVRVGMVEFVGQGATTKGFGFLTRYANRPLWIGRRTAGDQLVLPPRNYFYGTGALVEWGLEIATSNAWIFGPPEPLPEGLVPATVAAGETTTIDLADTVPFDVSGPLPFDPVNQYSVKVDVGWSKDGEVVRDMPAKTSTPGKFRGLGHGPAPDRVRVAVYCGSIRYRSQYDRHGGRKTFHAPWRPIDADLSADWGRLELIGDAMLPVQISARLDALTSSSFADLDLSEARSYPLPVGSYLLRWRSASQGGDIERQIVEVLPRDVTTVTFD